MVSSDIATRETPAVLFANEAYYAAFAGRDFSAMDALWAHHHAVTCIHPGWDLLKGREPVMESWQAILANPDSPAIRCAEATTRIVGSGEALCATVICYEIIGQTALLATNVFVKEADGWKLVHHQAGPSPRVPDDAAEIPPSLQ